ncbi:MobA/MobL family protein [Hyphomonas sp.]|jgi:hypothetical protein|uniref:MobA/MobL family protein n=1 Tax=Alphaproteobacteria TaxID=28211 RepID=UPI002EB4E447|nr:MobA/MobL family protein [Pseudomonadota bacterium]
MKLGTELRSKLFIKLRSSALLHLIPGNWGEGAITQTPFAARLPRAFLCARSIAGLDLQFMKHAACHFSLTNLTRGKTSSSVARAAYISRCRLTDERTGLTFGFSRRHELLADGHVNWSTGSSTLWNAVEQAEKRKNSRVAKEIKVALPAELPLDEMRRLVHGFCCNIKDRYGVALQFAIHAPGFHDDDEEKDVRRRLKSGEIQAEEYQNILYDPEHTNLNFHAHILFSRRAKDPETGEFTEIVRCLDDVRTGPQEISFLREEWEVRTNAALARAGADARVDLRSYDAMAEAGDAPKGLVAQKHLGPRLSHSGRIEPDARKEPQTSDRDKHEAEAARLRKYRSDVRKHNERLWTSWLELRALQREEAREEAALIAAEREAARKAEAKKEKQRILKAESREEAAEAIQNAVHISGPKLSAADVIDAVASGENLESDDAGYVSEFDTPLEMETYEPKASDPPPDRSIKKVKRRNPVRQRNRG